MSPDNQRIAIAEACGWKIAPPVGEHKLWFNPSNNRETALDRLLDYLNDLNAMHEAEMSLSDQSPGKDSNGESIPSDRARYRGKLAVLCMNAGGPIHATAARRAEAFIRTIGKWE